MGLKIASNDQPFSGGGSGEKGGKQQKFVEMQAGVSASSYIISYIQRGHPFFFSSEKKQPRPKCPRALNCWERKPLGLLGQNIVDFELYFLTQLFINGLVNKTCVSHDILPFLA
jgi:hypothetical protein